MPVAEDSKRFISGLVELAGEELALLTKSGKPTNEPTLRRLRETKEIESLKGRRSCSMTALVMYSSKDTARSKRPNAASAKRKSAMSVMATAKLNRLAMMSGKTETKLNLRGTGLRFAAVVLIK